MGLGMNKLLLKLNDVPIIIHTLRVFEKDPWCKSIILVINEDDRVEMETHIKEYGIAKVAAFVPGGRERQESVYFGLQKVVSSQIVLVHDGARPFVKTTYIHQLVRTALDHGAAVLAVPVKDTIKRVENHFIDKTIERQYLWLAQTPQAFQLPLLKEAHERAETEGFLGTDDASLVERINKPVAIIKGDYDNIKITTKEDLLFAEALLTKYRDLHK